MMFSGVFRPKVQQIFDRGLVEEIVLPGAEILHRHFLEIS